MDVMIVIDNPHRELRGMATVTRLLAERGLSSKIVSKIGYEEAFGLYRPSVVVLPRVLSDMARFARHAARSAAVALIPSEHGSGFREKVIANGLGLRPDGSRIADAAPEAVSRLYAGGSNQAAWLTGEGAYGHDRVVISGTLNSDHWMLPRRTKAGRLAGVATTFKAVFMGMPFVPLPELIELHRTPDWQDSLWRVDVAAFELAYLLILLDALQTLRDAGTRTSIRPHPHESVKAWRRYIKHVGGPVEVNRSLRLDHWLDSISFAICSFSTVTIDCVARGVPAISLERLVPQKYIDLLPAQKQPLAAPFAWRPRSREEMLELFQRALDGTLPCSPDLAASSRFMRENFHFPRQRLAAEIIVEDLSALVKEGAARRNKSRRRHPGAVVRDVSIMAKRMARDVKNYLVNPHSENLYFFFDKALRREAYGFAGELLASRGKLATGEHLTEPPPVAPVGAAEHARSEPAASPGKHCPLHLTRAAVDALVFDFDGVLTDNRVLVVEDGREAVFCNRGDGLAFERFRTAGIPCFILSKEQNPVVGARGRKLRIPVIQGQDEKDIAISELCAREGFDPRKVVYVGNDLNDLPAMAIVGLPIAVSDSHPRVKEAARWTLTARGGAGIVRELLEAFDDL